MKGFSFTQNNIEYVIVLPSVTYTSGNKVYVGSQELEIYDSTVMASLETAIAAYQPGGSGGSYDEGYADGEAAMESAIASSQAVTANLYKSKLASEDATIAAADSTDISGQGTIFSESYSYLKTSAEMQDVYDEGYGDGETDGEATGYASGQSDAASSQATVAGQYKSKLSSEDADIAAADATTLVGQGTIFSESYQYLKTSAEIQANYNSGYNAGEAAVATSQQPIASDYKSLLSGVDQTIAAADPTTLAGQMSIFNESYQYLNTGGGSGTPVRYIASPGMKTNLYAWTDGTNIYTGMGTDSYKFDPSTGLFEKFVNKCPIGISYFQASSIWTDGTNRYYLHSYILEKNATLWKAFSISNNPISSFSATDVWTDGTNTYYSYSSNHYIFNKAVTTWSAITWTGLTSFYGQYVWTDGTYTYYSYDADQYVLDKTTSSWNAKTWTGLTSFRKNYIWTDGTDIYYSNNTDQYVLDKATSTWSTKTWIGLTSFNGGYVWTDGTDIYYSNGSTHYILDKTTSTWSTKAWTGLTSFNGSGVWTDGINKYYTPYSYASTTYVLDKSTSTWSTTQIYKIIDFYGDNVWTDGTNVYYSAHNVSLVFDRSTSTWNTKAWNGLSYIYGRGAWTDGINIYYDYNYDHYVLDGNTWKSNTWTGMPSPAYGYYIWTDGTDIYYSNGGTQRVLDKSTSTWSTKTWTGLTSFNGNNVWTDGTDIYVAGYVLDKSTSTWNNTTVLATPDTAKNMMTSDCTKNLRCSCILSSFGQDRIGQFDIYMQETYRVSSDLYPTGKFSMFDKTNRTWTPVDVATVIVGDSDVVVNSSGTKTPVGDIDLSYKPKSNNP